MIEFQCRPIDQWPGKLTPPMQQESARFANAWGTLNKDLYRELEHLNAKGVAVLLALRDEDIRIDGRPRAGMKPAHPGVILVAETKHGPMRWACDKYRDWQQNLRAISMTLNRLRLIDEYGCTKRGEQYTGWKALPAPGDASVDMKGDAWSFLCGLLGVQNEGIPKAVENFIRAAEKQTHPDRGGNASDFKRVQEARKVLLG